MTAERAAREADAFAAETTDAAFGNGDNAAGVIAESVDTAITVDENVATRATLTPSSAVIPGAAFAAAAAGATAACCDDANRTIAMGDNFTVISDVDSATGRTGPGGYGVFAPR